MSYKSGFFDAIDQGDGDYDREYIAADFSHYFSLFIANGVFPDPSTNLQVKASAVPDMHVSVQPGSGWVNGYYITVPEESPELLTIPTANPTLSRIDSVIMGLNYVDREIQLYVKSGAVSSSPTPVELQRDTDLYELELCQITVKAGAASITQSSIKDTRQDSSRCGIVKGTVDQIDATDLFAQYDAAFQDWFEDVQSQLEGDVATNLLNRIIQLEQTVEENWNNTASSETKAIYNLSEENTPDDIFQAIFAVGDIKVSTRTDLGDNWLLCNGETFSANEYPDLGQFAEKKAIDWPTQESLEGRGAFLKYVNGFWFTKVANGGSFFSQSLEGPWEKCMGENGTTQHSFTEISYLNGIYYASSIQSQPGSTSNLQYSEHPKGPWRYTDSLFIDESGYLALYGPLISSDKYLFIPCRDPDYNEYFLLYSSNPVEDVQNRTFKHIKMQYPVNAATSNSGREPVRCPVATLEDKIFIGMSGVTSGSSNLHGLIIKDINGDTPTIDYKFFYVAGVASDGIILSDGKNIGVYSDENTLLYNIGTYPQSQYSGQAYELGNLIIVSNYWDGIFVYDKVKRKYIGTVGKTSETFYAQQNSFAGSDGTKVAVCLSQPSGYIGLAENALDITSGITPEISIPNAYVYIRGK